MDTNTMYIEHYIDLHNYISDNIYELNDDIIFTESIWKKVLIGGLAIGGIALIVKNWSKIMKFIQEHLPDRLKNIFNILEQAKKDNEESDEEVEEESDEEPNKDEDVKKSNEAKQNNEEEIKQEVKETPKADIESSEKKENNKSNKKKTLSSKIKKIFQSNKVKKLYIFDDIYNNKDKYLNQFIIYCQKEKNSKLTDDILNDKYKLIENTKQLSIHKMYEQLEQEDRIDKNYLTDVFEKLSLITKSFKDRINEKKFINNNEEFITIINSIEELLLIAYVYIYNNINDLDRFDKDYFYYFKYFTITAMLLSVYPFKIYSKNRDYNIILDQYKDKNTGNFKFNRANLNQLLKDINNLKNKKYDKISNEKYINANIIDYSSKSDLNKEKPPKFAYINIHTFLNYRRWFLYQLINIFDAIQSWTK